MQVPVQLTFVESFLAMFWGLFPSVSEEEVSLSEGRYHDLVSASGSEPEPPRLLQTSTLVDIEQSDLNAIQLPESPSFSSRFWVYYTSQVAEWRSRPWNCYDSLCFLNPLFCVAFCCCTFPVDSFFFPLQKSIWDSLWKTFYFSGVYLERFIYKRLKYWFFTLFVFAMFFVWLWYPNVAYWLSYVGWVTMSFWSFHRHYRISAETRYAGYLDDRSPYPRRHSCNCYYWHCPTCCENCSWAVVGTYFRTRENDRLVIA